MNRIREEIVKALAELYRKQVIGESPGNSPISDYSTNKSNSSTKGEDQKETQQAWERLVLQTWTKSHLKIEELDE
jgi:hypothetical protein